SELLARARGIDRAQVRGSGEGGQIRRRDVVRAIEEQERAKPAPKTATTTVQPPAKESKPAGPAVPAQAPTGSIALRGGPAALAKHMEESLQIPTATSFRTVRVDVLDQRRRQLNRGIQEQGRPEKLPHTNRN